MSASPLNFLRAGPPPPKVVFLSDALFFSRTLPIPAETLPADVAAQVELTLESISPFPVAQLYHGYFHPPGSANALVFAAYRRRFTPDQTETWTEADLVLPTFAALLGAPLVAGTTLLLTHADSLTAIRAAADGAAQIFTAPLIPAGDDLPAHESALAAAKSDLLRTVGGSTTVIDLATLPVAQSVTSDGEFVFTAGEIVSRLPAATAAAIDVRDKTDLAARRRAHARDVLFWRVAVGCVAALVLLALGEFALMAGRGFWQKSRLAQLNAQKPTVEKIIAAQAVATRIEDLSTKRLLPMEMISLVFTKTPEAIRFVRAVADKDNREHIILDAKTNNSGEIALFKTALEALPECERIEISRQGNVSGTSTTTFTLSVTFKPGSVKPAST